jgi:hypothetical protein
MWHLWWTKWRWGRFSPSTSVSPANLYSTNFSTITIIYHLGWYNRPVVAAVPSGLSLTPLTLIKNKKNKNREAYKTVDRYSVSQFNPFETIYWCVNSVFYCDVLFPQTGTTYFSLFDIFRYNVLLSVLSTCNLFSLTFYLLAYLLRVEVAAYCPKYGSSCKCHSL